MQGGVGGEQEVLPTCHVVASKVRSVRTRIRGLGFSNERGEGDFQQDATYVDHLHLTHGDHLHLTTRVHALHLVRSISIYSNFVELREG